MFLDGMRPIASLNFVFPITVAQVQSVIPNQLALCIVPHGGGHSYI
jgi:hypothetical protein